MALRPANQDGVKNRAESKCGFRPLTRGRFTDVISKGIFSAWRRSDVSSSRCPKTSFETSRSSFENRGNQKGRKTWAVSNEKTCVTDRAYQTNVSRQWIEALECPAWCGPGNTF